MSERYSVEGVIEMAKYVAKLKARIRELETALDEIIELSSDNTEMPPPDSIRGRACSFEIDELMKICCIARKALRR